jgi:hypothetical protein
VRAGNDYFYLYPVSIKHSRGADEKHQPNAVSSLGECPIGSLSGTCATNSHSLNFTFCFAKKKHPEAWIDLQISG